MANLSPMMQQYFQIKEQYPDTLLFFRLGDFYEMFFDDAKLASRELELTLTGRDCGQEERAPMCGVPYHSCESYIARLVEKGYKVAICEQLSDPSAKGLVDRDIVRVITPGTVVEGSMLDETRNNYLCVVAADERGAGVCFVDASTGELNVTEVTGADFAERTAAELGHFMPKEVLLNSEAGRMAPLTEFIRRKLSCASEVLPEDHFSAERACELACRHFGAGSPEELKMQPGGLPIRALGAALLYLMDTQKMVLKNISTINLYSSEQFMRLDISTRRNLELCENMITKQKRGSLLWVMDQTKTAMGKRMIRSWIEQPLLNCARITRRQNAVEEFVNQPVMLGEMREQLSGIYDLERIMARIVYGTATARELKSMQTALERLPGLKITLSGVGSELLREMYEMIDTLEDVASLLEASIVDEPPATLKEGGVIKRGYHDALDQVRSDMTGGRGIIAEIEAREREKTGIKSLKVGYNRVFGYYIEVSNSYRGQVPQEYIRKQTLTNCERFITQELKDLENRVLGAQERAVQMEHELFEQVRSAVAGELPRIQGTAHAVAALDTLGSLAHVAAAGGFCKPDIAVDGVIRITEGRHPVVERVLDSPFVPNDTLLDSGENRCAIITGPNMAGKSTYMRQVAIITLLAQTGSFVPAASAHISLVDAIYTRVGASDDLATGQSTFMVEMNEVANILKNATRNSLLILDEIGRGTSTFDGMSIARAVLEHVCDKRRLGAKTLFATHYHELTRLEQEMEGIKNYNVAVKKRGDDIIFLCRIVPGGVDDSYGIEVAKLAGIPQSVVNRAKQVLKELEQENGRTPAARPVYETAENQMSLLDFGGAEIVEELKKLDVNTLTPIESMSRLYALCEKAKNM